MPRKKYDIIVLNEKFGAEIVLKYKQGSYAYELAEKYLGNKQDTRFIFEILKMNRVEKRTSKENADNRQVKGDNPNSFVAKYTQNDNYFSSWSYNMAYLLGYLATDGAIGENGVIKFGLASKDKELLEKIKNELQFTGPITHKETYLESTQKFYGVDEMVIRSRKIVSDLRKLGVYENKTFSLRRFDFIPFQYQKAFILGVIDGDGCYDRILGAKCSSSVQMRVRLCSASLEFIEGVRDMMANNGFTYVKVEKSNDKKRKNDFYNLEYSTKDAINFLSCYENVSIYLNRKIEKLVELIEMRKEYEENKKTGLKLRVSEMLQEYNITKSSQQPCNYKVEKVRQTESEMTD